MLCVSWSRDLKDTYHIGLRRTSKVNVRGHKDSNLERGPRNLRVPLPSSNRINPSGCVMEYDLDMSSGNQVYWLGPYDLRPQWHAIYRCSLYAGSLGRLCSFELNSVDNLSRIRAWVAYLKLGCRLWVEGCPSWW